MAAVQAWPVIYYEGEQNRYYHNVVKDLNLMKVVKFIESLGIDLHQMFAANGSHIFMAASSGTDFFEILMQIEDTLAKVDLTIYDVIEMINDAGITGNDIAEVYDYIKGTDASSAGENIIFNEDVEVPIYLLKLYEQILADWLMLGGIDVEYSLWGW
jgi:hypothetical protein